MSTIYLNIYVKVHEQKTNRVLWRNKRPRKIISFISIWDQRDVETRDVGSYNLLDL
jgi:hypothetical protein